MLLFVTMLPLLLCAFVCVVLFDTIVSYVSLYCVYRVLVFMALVLLTFMLSHVLLHIVACVVAYVVVRVVLILLVCVCWCLL